MSVSLRPPDDLSQRLSSLAAQTGRSVVMRIWVLKVGNRREVDRDK